MSRYRPEKLSSSEIKVAINKLVEAGSHLGQPREPTIAETALKIPCTRCAAEGKERTFYNVLIVLGDTVPGGYVLSCKKCNTVHLVSTNKEDAQSVGTGKFMREAWVLAGKNGWPRGERVLRGLTGEFGLVEMEECLRYIGSGDAMMDWDFWKALAKGLGQAGQVTITWNGVAANYPYDRYLYFVLLDITLRDLDEEQFWEAVLWGRLEGWLAANLHDKGAGK